MNIQPPPYYYPPSSNSQAARLVVVQGSASQAALDLSTASLLIGRDNSCGLVVNEVQVSRQHARIDYLSGNWIISDLNSSNGTFINNTSITRHTLRHGDLVQIGQTVLRFEVTSQAYAPPPVYVAVPPVEKKKPSGCLLPLTCGCVGIVVLLLLIVGGGYYAYTQELITLDMFLQPALNLVGMGPAELEVDNFREDTVHVRVYALGEADSLMGYDLNYEINPYDVRVIVIPYAGNFHLDFGTSVDGTDLGTCQMTIKSGDKYQFVPLQDQIIINDLTNPVESGADLVVSSSELCR